MNLKLKSQYTLILTLLISLPIIFLIGPRFLTPHQLPISNSDEIDDLKLFNRAISSSAVRSNPSSSFAFSRLGSRNPNLKIAFLFLTNTNLHFAPLWEQFFNQTTPKFYNIYVHANPAIADPGGVFSGKFIHTKHTERSSATLISASRRLIANAVLDDNLNYYFALVSQSCIPLHSFEFMYKSLFVSTAPFGRNIRVRYKSFIEILANETTLPARYVARGDNVMLPEVKFEDFRVGSQFFVMNKKHALMVLKERKLWRKFRKPCLRVHSCYPEEHYFPTLLSMEDPIGCSNYTLTRVNWTGSVDGHPHTYRPPEVSPELIYTLRSSNFSRDYLFARKFSPDSLELLMDMADGVIFND